MVASVELISVTVLSFRNLRPPTSAMYNVVFPSNAQPLIPLNIALDPIPSAEPQEDEILVRVHKNGGCALNPVTAHAVTGTQGRQAEDPRDGL